MVQSFFALMCEVSIVGFFWLGSSQMGSSGFLRLISNLQAAGQGDLFRLQGAR
ncbi:hypothetical protein VDG1235_2043 [Verrucomicrobiia bacterium DG1235]|nr:hypothetical protein VDG1235_2043 [Verrucomicrobiae bacterium DG1235]